MNVWTEPAGFSLGSRPASKEEKSMSGKLSLANKLMLGELRGPRN